MTYEEFRESLNNTQREFLKDELVKRLEGAEKRLAFIEGAERDSEFYSFHSEAGEYIKSASIFKNLLGDPELEQRHKACLWKFLAMGED